MNNTVFGVIILSQIFYLITEPVGSHTDESVDFSFTIVLVTNNCSIIKDLKVVISDLFLGKLPCSSIIFILSGTNFSLLFIDGVSQFTGSGSNSSVALGRREP